MDLREHFDCEYGWNIYLGEDVYIGPYCDFQDAGRIEIGDRAMIGRRVQIGTTVHSLDPVERQQADQVKPVSIGADVMIYRSSIISPGITIGAGSIISAGSMVTRDIPERVLARGVPCRVIRPISQ